VGGSHDIMGAFQDINGRVSGYQWEGFRMSVRVFQVNSGRV
jgi:hypothetical protein